jgi:AmiR/NasT family two-component response regulator
MGILMERHKLSADEAFSVLSRASQESNIKLREIARRVADTGETAGIA